MGVDCSPLADHISWMNKYILTAPGGPRTRCAFRTDPRSFAVRSADQPAGRIIWLAVRGDDPLEIMQRAVTPFPGDAGLHPRVRGGHAGLGDVFPPVPLSLCKGETISIRKNNAE
jgi:hypothetical protein